MDNNFPLILFVGIILGGLLGALVGSSIVEVDHKKHLKKLGLFEYNKATGEGQYLDLGGNVIQLGEGDK